MSTTTGTRTDTRQRIMDVALELFSANGFEGTSLQQIADRLELTKAALYYHFRSKDDLLAAIVGPAFDDLELRLNKIESAKPSAASRRAGLAQYLDYLIDNRAIIGFLTRDLALLAHPAVTARGGGLQERIDRLLMGRDLDPDERLLSSIALSGMQGAIAAPIETDLQNFREIVLHATEAVLRSGRRRARPAA